MEVIHSPNEMQNIVINHRNSAMRIGFVPTMGALHDGHMSLVREARQNCDILILSIFVNPLQFAPSEDLDKYPRTLESDSKLALIEGVDYIFAPSAREMYPQGYDSTVSCGGITSRLEGASRPGHFDGVTTVVLKLFNITLPHFAVFGQKDAQQSLVIKRMVLDLNMPVELIVAPTQREEDGLAMSSRNRYLTKTERCQAAAINEGLGCAFECFQSGERDASTIKKVVEQNFTKSNLITVEYIAVTDSNCTAFNGAISSDALLSVACRTIESNTRLIDNLVLVHS